MRNQRGLEQLWPAIMLVVGVMLATAFLANRSSEKDDAAAAVDGGKAKYTVVETDGRLLIVTDNSTNTLHFYTLDESAEPGEPVKLRGSIDLNKVGAAELQVKLAEQSK